MTNRYFRLFPHCERVRGPFRSAVYDFGQGKLFHLDEHQTLVLEQCEQNVPVEDITVLPTEQVEQILDDLSQFGLGRFYNTAIYVDPFMLNSPLELPGLMEPPPMIQIAYLQVATDCNLNCSFCGETDSLAWLGCNSCLRWPGVEADQKLSPEDIDRIVDQLMTLEVMNVHFSGCNPLLHFDLVQHTVERIRAQQHFPVGIVLHTNGIGLTPDFLAYAFEKNLCFNFSLFGRGTEDCLHAIEQCRAHEIPFIVTVVLPPNEQGTWQERKEQAESTGAVRVLFTEFISREHPQPVVSVPVNEPRQQTFTRDYFFFRKRFNVCMFGSLAIDAQMQLRPCPMMTESLGDLNHETLHSILEKGDLKSHWHYTKNQVPVCQDCEFRGLCGDCSLIEHQVESHPELLSAICGYNPYTGTWSSPEELVEQPYTEVQ